MADNKSVVRDFFKVLGSGDSAGVNALVTPDIVATATGSSVMSRSRTREELLAVVDMTRQATKSGFDFQVLHLTAEDDRVSAEVKGQATLANGVEYNNEYHFLFFLSGGKIRVIREYSDTKLVEERFGAMMAGVQ